MVIFLLLSTHWTQGFKGSRKNISNYEYEGILRGISIWAKELVQKMVLTVQMDTIDSGTCIYIFLTLQLALNRTAFLS